MNIKTISLHKSKCILVMVFSILSISIIEIYGQEQSSNLQDTLDSLHNVAGKEYIELRDKFLSGQNALEFLAKIHKENTEQPDWLVNALYVRAKNQELADKLDLWLELQTEEKPISRQECNKRLLAINPKRDPFYNKNLEDYFTMPLTKLKKFDLDNSYFPTNAREEPPFSIYASSTSYEIAFFEEEYGIESPKFSLETYYLVAEALIKEGKIPDNETANFIFANGLAESIIFAETLTPGKKEKSDVDYLEDITYYKKTMLPLFEEMANSNITWQKVPGMMAISYYGDKKEKALELFLAGLQDQRTMVRSASLVTIGYTPFDSARFDSDSSYRNKILDAFLKYWIMEKADKGGSGLELLRFKYGKWVVAVLEMLMQSENNDEERKYIQYILDEVNKRTKEKDERIIKKETSPPKENNIEPSKESSVPEERSDIPANPHLKEIDENKNVRIAPQGEPNAPTGGVVEEKTTLLKSPWFYFSCGVFLILVFAALFYAIKNRRK